MYLPLSISSNPWFDVVARFKGEYDAIIIPGGLKGAETISQSFLAQSLVKIFYESGKTVGMICAGEPSDHGGWGPFIEALH
jgi:putative intracellular protease/amidase